jgi:hypothetical protein
MWQCPECPRSLRWSLNKLTQPKPGEPSICGWCAAFVIFTDDLALRALDRQDRPGLVQDYPLRSRFRPLGQKSQPV